MSGYRGPVSIGVRMEHEQERAQHQASPSMKLGFLCMRLMVVGVVLMLVAQFFNIINPALGMVFFVFAVCTGCIAAFLIILQIRNFFKYP